MKQTTNKELSHAHQDKAEKTQKENFYGKDGFKYSKTITKEMACNLDENIEEYKKKIFSKQPTIEELSEENTESKPSNRPTPKTDSQDAVDSYLDDLASSLARTK